jgi:hypothetical protein
MKPWAVSRLDDPNGQPIERVAEADTREELQTKYKRRQLNSARLVSRVFAHVVLAERRPALAQAGIAPGLDRAVDVPVRGPRQASRSAT